MTLSKEELLRHADALSFPRKSGSPGEKKAFQYILEHFKKHFLDCHVQKFSFSSSWTAILFRFIPVFLLALLAIALFLSSFSPVAALAIIVLAITIFSMSTKWNRLMEHVAGWHGTQTSNNIIARIPNDEAEKEFVFMAHYDSKSQTFPLSLRVANTILFVVCFIISLSGIIGIIFDVPLLSREMMLYPLALCLISLLFDFLNCKGNLSPGAIDNATGIALLLEIARVLKSKKNHGKCAFTFVATGAEEEGLFGARHFIKQNKSLFMKRESLFINFDGAGAPGKIVIRNRYGIPPRRSSKNLVIQILLAAKKIKVDVKRGYLPPGVGVDALPIAHHGFEVITFSSQTWNRATFSIHSSRDVPENISADSLERLALLSLALAEC